MWSIPDYWYCLKNHTLGARERFKMFLCNLKLQIPLSKSLLFSDNLEVFD